MLWEARYLITGNYAKRNEITELTNLKRFDPSKFIIEHYVDGDLVNDKTPTGRIKAHPDNLHVWGMQ